MYYINCYTYILILFYIHKSDSYLLINNVLFCKHLKQLYNILRIFSINII